MAGLGSLLSDGRVDAAKKVPEGGDFSVSELMKGAVARDVPRGSFPPLADLHPALDDHRITAMKITNAHYLCTLTTALCIAACTTNDPGSDDDDTGIETITTSAGETTGNTTDETSGSSTDATTDGSTGDPECASDDDCIEGFLCNENGECEFDDSCGEASAKIPIVTPNVVLVLDKSGSMVANSWDGDDDPDTPDVSRWFSLFSVVDLIVSDFDASMNLGMTLYPSKKAKSEYNLNACLVEPTPDVPVAPQNGANVLMSMPAADAINPTIAGGTPARAGVIAAYEHLLDIDDELPKYVVLVTDGAANCSLEAEDEISRFEVYDAALTQTIADAYSEGITTFVVGIDIQDVTSDSKQDGNPDATNTFERLNELAIAGGMPQEGATAFYDSQNQIELQAALTAISEQALSCDIVLD
ncbi:MAG TPA: VWA domain-containing protein, partial [Nannocystis exedens]|nr:VWA domain-containing protein [Nannocystis exedens]